MRLLLTINYYLKKGGLKLKFIGFTIAVTVITISILSFIIINLMSKAIEEKAFEVASSSIKHIANSSRLALLERNYENKINLNENVNILKNSKIEGFLDISIYENDKNKFLYLSGYKKYSKSKYLNDPKLIKKLMDTKTNLLVEEKELQLDGEKINVYQFTSPVFFKYKEKDVLLGIVILLYDKNTIYSVVNKAIAASFIITFFVVLISIILVYSMGNKLTKPILNISENALNVARGNLDVNLKIDSNDELGILARSFNHMVDGLRQREKMQKFVSTSTMDMIQKDSKAKLILGGEYRTITFLFSDIRGFTSMSETKKPDEVVEIVNFYLNLQSEIIKKNDGDIDKFVGDEVMASFSGEDSLQRAISCAVEIQNSIFKRNKIRLNEKNTICNVGIGINKGEVIVGNIGSNDRMDFTSIGSTVNVASRLCSLAKENEIVVGQTLDESFKKIYNIQEQSDVLLKGINKGLDVSYIKALDVI